MASPLIYIIAGEPSGDRLAARLMASLIAQTNGQVRFTGVGGSEMEKLDFKSLFPMSDLTVMGLAEVLPRLPNLLRRIKETVSSIIKEKPDAVVTIDAPDFSLRVAKRVADKNIPLIHLVAPSVWAWKPGRARKIAPLLDHLMTLLPFEPPYFEKEGLASTFVGHSVIESGADQGDGAAFRARHSIPANAKVLCVLPGSRHGEINRLLPVMREAIERMAINDLHIVLPTIQAVEDEVQKVVTTWPQVVTLVTGDTEKFDAFAASNAAIAASGTVALELALARVPHVIVYKFNALTAIIARRLVKTPYVNLTNILLNREAVPELIQEKCRGDIAASHISRYLADDEAAKEQIESFDQAISKLQDGDELPSVRAARVVLDIIQQRAKLAS
ncbi:MAG: lipid-A-disaccharide synthase [Rhodospirillaceae bacterium]|jgi:lipid-A-disaccharide synthase|nr:lipid-A-disaccharide synthase [Rhodospirillaceae bacterium]MBT4589270.1 lipid-A-disaccharide synthase [Rhodospirillaceae bacterium]MBT5941101.1 lipid-A-disaccharide synthase [Rhodospirillaceae bacterium]